MEAVILQYIEATKTDDTQAILEITRQAEVFSEEEVACVDELLNEYFTRGAERSGYYFLTCHSQGKVAGYICYGPRPLTQGTYDLFWIAAASGSGRNGIGRALVERAAENVRRMGGRLLIAETSSKPEYLPARRFYEKAGFTCEGVIHDFYAPGDDLVVFELRV